MTGTGRAVVWRWLCGVVGAAALAGLFAMHGVTAGHDAAMVGMHRMGNHQMMAAHDAGVGEASSQSLPPSGLSQHITSLGTGHGMTPMCLAVLAAALLLLFRAALSRAGAGARAIVTEPAGGRPMLRAPPPTSLLAPSSSRLCILRV